MYFSAPEALWGLLLLAIPFIVHFFSLRKAKRVLFSDLRYLTQITEVTRNRETIRKRLILASRLLAILALVFLFAGWALSPSDAENSSSGVTSIFIDNSPSTALFSQEGSLLDEMRASATQIIKSAGPEERFQLITAELRQGEQQLLSKEAALSELAAIKPGTATRKLSQVLERQKNAIRQYRGTGRRFLLSDFQQSFADWKKVKADTSLPTAMYHFQAASQKNVFIDSVWMASPVLIPGQPATMVVRVNNTGQDETVTVPWSLELDGKTRLNRNITIPGNGFKLDSVVFTLPQTGWHAARLLLRDHPVTFDDQFFYSFYLRSQIKVLVISEQTPSPYLQSFFEQEPYLDVKYIQTSSFSPSMADEVQVIIADGINQPTSGLSASWLSWLKPGKVLFLIPGTMADPAVWSTALQPIVGGMLVPWKETQARVKKPGEKEPFFNGVFNAISNQSDWPVVTKTLQPAPNSGFGLRELLSIESGGGLLYQGFKQGGVVYWLSTALDDKFGNFQTHSLLVPVLYRICLMGTGSQHLTAYSGQSQQLPLELKLQQEQVLFAGKLNEERLPLLNRTGGQLAISFQNDRPWEPGFYPLQVKGTDSLVGILAMNRQYEESQLTYPEVDDLKRESEARGFKLQSIANASTFQSATTGQHVAKVGLWLCLLSLLALLSESLLIRYQSWKKS